MSTNAAEETTYDNVSQIPVRLANGKLFNPSEEECEAFRRKHGLRKGMPSFTNSRVEAEYEVKTYVEARGIEKLYTQAEINTYARDRINSFVPNAMDIIEDIIMGAIPAPVSVRAKYAHLHLGRAGFGVITKIDSTTLNQHLTRDEIEEIKKAAEAALAEGSTNSK